MAEEGTSGNHSMVDDAVVGTTEEEDNGPDDDCDQGVMAVEEDETAVVIGWEELMGKDLLKKTLQPSNDGTAAVSVQPQDAVIVDFVGRLACADPYSEDNKDMTSDADGPIFHEAQNWLLVIGEKDVLPVLEMGIRFMVQGETAAVWGHSKYAYGPGPRTWTDSESASSYILPANSNVVYTVTLKRIVGQEELNQRRFQLQLCQSKKRIANDIYNHDSISSESPYAKSRALQVYKRAAEMLDYMLQDAAREDAAREDATAAAVVDAAVQAAALEEDAVEVDAVHTAAAAEDAVEVADEDNARFDRTAARECLLDCLNNVAAVHLKCRSYHAAKESCVAVLEKDPTNFKALMRAAKASLLDPASSYDEVDAAITAAAEQCQDNEKMATDVERLRADFQRRKQAHAKREKLLYSKMNRATVATAATTDDAKDDNKLSDGAAANDEVEAVEQDDDNQEAVGSPPSSESPVVTFLKTLPWRNVILPYGFQLMLPLVMYYYFKIMRGNRGGQQQQPLDETAVLPDDGHDEF